MKRLAFALVFVLLISICTQKSYAQQTQNHSQISFEIETVVPDSSILYSSLPTELMDTFTGYDELSLANIKMVQKKYILRATFVFDNTQSFRTWYHSKKIKSLFKKLKKESSSLDFSYRAAR